MRNGTCHSEEAQIVCHSEGVRLGGRPKNLPRSATPHLETLRSHQGDFERDADALPDYFDYCDEGCDLFPSCLECPLPRCRYDGQAGERRATTGLRDSKLLNQRREDGKSVAELASSFSVSKRTVQRIIKSANSSSAPKAAQTERRPSNDRHTSIPGSNRKPHPAAAARPHGP